MGLWGDRPDKTGGSVSPVAEAVQVIQIALRINVVVDRSVRISGESLSRGRKLTYQVIILQLSLLLFQRFGIGFLLDFGRIFYLWFHCILLTSASSIQIIVILWIDLPMNSGCFWYLAY